jgi:hypothetical protein
LILVWYPNLLNTVKRSVIGWFLPGIRRNWFPTTLVILVVVIREDYAEYFLDAMGQPVISESKRALSSLATGLVKVTLAKHLKRKLMMTI